MKKTLAFLLALTAASAFTPARAGTSVGVSIGINEPGIYGRINIGDLPRPALVYPQPVVIVEPPVRYDRRPIYLYVPAPHQKDWRRYCGRYNACGQPVYFVQDQWVRERYAQEHPGWAKKQHRGRDHHRDDRGHGKGHGHGHGKGHGHSHGHDKHDRDDD